MDDHIGILVKSFFRISKNLDAPGGILGTDDFSQVAAGLGGVQINRADDFDGPLFAHQFRDGCTDGTDAILNGANLLFHDGLRLLR